MVGDPDGDWSRFTKVSGWTVNPVAIGNAPAANLNGLIPGGGTISYDIINIVGDIRLIVDFNLLTHRAQEGPQDRNIGNFLIAGPKCSGAPDVKETFWCTTRYAWVLVQIVADSVALLRSGKSEVLAFASYRDLTFLATRTTPLLTLGSILTRIAPTPLPSISTPRRIAELILNLPLLSLWSTI